MLVPYPSDFPSVAIGILADTLRGKNSDKARAIHAAWIVAGWGLGNFVPDNQPQIVGANLENDESQAEFLESMIQDRLDGKVVQGVFPWVVVIRIALRIISNLV